MKKLLSLLISFVIALNSAYAVPTGPDISNTCGLSQPCGLLISQINVYLANTDWLKSRNAANNGDINLLRADSSDDTNLNSDSGDFIYFTIGGDANRKFTWNASSDAALSYTWGDGGTTATQILTFSASTADADDDSSLVLAGGGAAGATRGATIILAGEEVAGGGDITMNTGTGDTYILQVAGTTELTLADDSLLMSGAASVFGTTGATSLAFQVNSVSEMTLTNDQLAFSGAAAEIVPGATSIAFKNNADAVNNLLITDAGAVTAAGNDLGWRYKTGANTACTTTCTFAAVFGVDLAGGATAPVIVDPTNATADACICAGAT